MRIEPLGDAAYVLRELGRPAYEVANALNTARPPGLLEAVAAYETVGLYVDPDEFRADFLGDEVSITPASPSPRRIEIPVCYELGPDLEEAAHRLAITPEELIRRHAAATYRCFAIGFCPGFPYLGYLDPDIAGLPRRSTPRVRVPSGSVAITGRQTGVYPLERPGGWWLIGRTPLCLVDVAAAYFPISAGDEVGFAAIGREEYATREGERP